MCIRPIAQCHCEVSILCVHPLSQYHRDTGTTNINVQNQYNQRATMHEHESYSLGTVGRCGRT